MPPKALQGLRVLEFAEFVSGPYCAKLMADLGAEVIKIEPPDLGDESRRRGPFPNDLPDQDASGLFLYLNTGKLGVTLDPSKLTGRRIFEKLVAQADILIENNPVGVMSKLGLGFDSLKTINPKLIMASITPFGQSGPYAHWKSYYLNTFHAGGEGYTLPGGIGWQMYPERPPLKAGGFIGEYNCGVAAATAIVGAAFGCLMCEAGQYIEISEQEVLASLMRTDLGKYNDGWVESRATRSVPIGGFIHCKDGFVQLIPLWKHMWTALVAAMGNPEWAGEARFQHERLMAGWQGVTRVSDDILRDREEANERIEQWAMQYNSEEIYTVVQRHGCIAAPVCSVADLFSSKQLQAREFIPEVEHPEAGCLKYLGAPYKFSETPWRIDKPAPLLGRHNEEVYCNRLGYSRQELVQMRRAGII
ncbi:MAG: CoA transferase [Dehalococcoidia bacterium]|nr:CoA transferase [Dehalococcoidia bacterium]